MQSPAMAVAVILPAMSDESNSTPLENQSHETVPYYAPCAYASGPRRVIALLIDLFVSGVLLWGP